jgi:hypothetical protein
MSGGSPSRLRTIRSGDHRIPGCNAADTDLKTCLQAGLKGAGPRTTTRLATRQDLRERVTYARRHGDTGQPLAQRIIGDVASAPQLDVAIHPSLVPVRRSVPAQALIIVRLRVLAPADAGFLVTVCREHRLVFRVRWHRPIISRPAVNVRPCQPLPGETIGENFNRMAMTHADREALVDRPTARRWTYAELHHDDRTVGRTVRRRELESDAQ